MELVEGEELSRSIARGPIPERDALVIAKQIAEALEAAHEHGIIHRDLKPGNIRLRPDGTVKVLDFGLAKAMASTEPSAADETMPGTILGTSAYMERMTAMSSMCWAVRANSSLTSMPFLPWRRKANGERMAAPVLRSVRRLARGKGRP